MTKERTTHVCADCGAGSPRWLGRCPGCGGWNTLVEERPVPAPTAGTARPVAGVAPTHPAVLIGEVDLSAWEPMSTGLSEVDRVLGGGLVPGSATLLGGEPGIGKSTLLLQMLASMAQRGITTLLVTAEESAQQVRLRAERLGAAVPGLHVAADAALPVVLGHVEAVQPDLLVVDSIQTVLDPALGAASGTVSQVRDCAARLVHEAKQRAMATVLVGHVTKEGALAGPRLLEHLVDTVLSFEGDRAHALRLLRAAKHRFGSTHDLGVFEMTDSGLRAVPDASGLFLADRRSGVPGSVVAPIIDGHRPLLVELQALTATSSFAQPRRSAQGLDAGRLALLAAVLEGRAAVPLGKLDVFASAVGGVRVAEPGADLAVALAVASSVGGHPVAGDLVACGEVGLGGEIRQVTRTPHRLAEAARLGFRQAIVPVTAPPAPQGIVARRVGTLDDAIAVAGCFGRSVSVVA